MVVIEGMCGVGVTSAHVEIGGNNAVVPQCSIEGDAISHDGIDGGMLSRSVVVHAAAGARGGPGLGVVAGTSNKRG